LKVGVDLDGVCYDFADSLREYLVRHGLAEKYSIIPGEPDKWHFYHDWGMTTEEFVKHCNDGVDARIVFGWGQPRDLAPSALSFIRSFGHTVHIITDRQFGFTPEVSQEVTKFWLDGYGVEYDTLTFSADKTCVETDVFVEDKLENYDALIAAGVDCYLIDRPWNQDPGDNRKRIKSIQEFATIVANMSV